MELTIDNALQEGKQKYGENSIKVVYDNDKEIEDIRFCIDSMRILPVKVTYLSLKGKLDILEGMTVPLAIFIEKLIYANGDYNEVEYDFEIVTRKKWKKTVLFGCVESMLILICSSKIEFCGKKNSEIVKKIRMDG